MQFRLREGMDIFRSPYESFLGTIRVTPSNPPSTLRQTTRTPKRTSIDDLNSLVKSDVYESNTGIVKGEKGVVSRQEGVF